MRTDCDNTETENFLSATNLADYGNWLVWRRHVATSSCCGHVDKLVTEPFLLLHCEHGTGYDGAEIAAIDGLVSSWSENISVSFCLRHQDTDWLCGAPSVF